MDIVLQTPRLGAEVFGVDLSGSLADSLVGDIRQALLDYKVIWFRSQHLGPEDLERIAANFGDLTEAHPVEPSLKGHSEILPLDALEGARADVWHSDLTFQSSPPLGAFLYSLQIPPVGGDTLWADMCALYQSLSPRLQGMLEELSARHSPEKAGGYFANRDASDGSVAKKTSVQDAIHPVVRLHPETGAKSIFVNPLFTDKIVGLRRGESDLILNFLYKRATIPEHVVRWKWEVGDFVFWDNRCTMHYALLDFGSAPRRLLRVALAGDEPTGCTLPK